MLEIHVHTITQPITWLMYYYATFTGWGCHSESTTRLPFLCIGVCTDLLWCTCLLIYRASRTCHRDSDYSYGRRTRYPSRRRTCPLSTTTLSQLSLHESRTLCRRTFGHPVLWQRSSVGSRPSFSHEVSPTDANARISVSFIRWPHSFGLSQSNLLLSFYY